MKKVLSALVLSAAVVATAGQAQAYDGNFYDLTDRSLTLGMYDKTGFNPSKWEIGVNLGEVGVDWNFSDHHKNLLDNPGNTTQTAVKNALLGYQDLFTSKGAIVNDVRIGFYMQDGTTPNSVYIATKSNVIPTVVPNKQANLNNGMKGLDQYYENNDSLNGFASLSGTTFAYQSKLDGTWGGYGSFNGSYQKSQVRVGNISDEVGYIDFYLWHYVSGVLDQGDEYGNGAVTDYTAVLRFNKEGSVVLNPNGLPSAVPVPAAAWLLGSGILGLFGLRRRK